MEHRDVEEGSGSGWGWGWEDNKSITYELLAECLRFTVYIAKGMATSK